jgi:hypothetical protein
MILIIFMNKMMLYNGVFLRQALNSRNTKHIDLCRFLIDDVSDVLHQPMTCKSNRQFYRGLKITNEGLEKLTKHTGKLICLKGFFTCNKSRKVDLDLARSSNYRPDLRPALLKINCPPFVPLGEVPTVGTGGLVVFDVYTAFCVKYVNRGPVIAHHNGREFDLALACRHRALDLQKTNQTIDQSLIASSLIGIANAQWVKRIYLKHFKILNKP